MADKKRSIVIYTDLLQHLNMLSVEEAGSVFLAILNYAESGTIPELSSVANMCFSFIRAQIDRDAGKWTATIDKRIEAGRLGGLAKAHNNADSLANLANAKSAKQTLANASKSKQTLANVAVNGTVTVNGTGTVTVNDELEQAIIFFKEHRKKLGKPMTDHAADLLRKKLEELAPNDKKKQADLVDYAITKGWQSVYLPDEKDRKQLGIKPQERGSEPDEDRYAITDGFKAAF